MQTSDIHYLFGYDRWATQKVLVAAAGLSSAEWPAGQPIGTRTLGEILVHALGAHQRWRNGLAQTTLLPRPERESPPSGVELIAAWEAEWRAMDAWLASIDDAWLARTDEGVTFWQMLAHVVNHGTQHRAEAAALLTGLDRSPGDLDMIFYAEEVAKAASKA